MKTIITVLIVVTAVQAAVLEVEPTKKTFLRPTRINQLKIFSPDGITVRWIPVKISKEPTVGYKLTLRMFEGPKSVNETEVEAEEIEIPNISDISRTKPHKAYEYVITGADNREVTIHGVKKETPYMLDVFPYSAKGDGPVSPPLIFIILKDNNIRYVTQTDIVIINTLS